MPVRSVTTCALCDMPSVTTCGWFSRERYSPCSAHDDKPPALNAPCTIQSPTLPTGAPTAADATPRAKSVRALKLEPGSRLVVR